MKYLPPHHHHHFSLSNLRARPEVFGDETHWTFPHIFQSFIVPVPTVVATVPPIPV